VDPVFESTPATSTEGSNAAYYALLALIPVAGVAVFGAVFVLRRSQNTLAEVPMEYYPTGVSEIPMPVIAHTPSGEPIDARTPHSPEAIVVQG